MSPVTCGQRVAAVVLPFLSSDPAAHLLLQEISLSPEGTKAPRPLNSWQSWKVAFSELQLCAQRSSWTHSSDPHSRLGVGRIYC